jgi:hypothetical protein
MFGSNCLVRSSAIPCKSLICRIGVGRRTLLPDAFIPFGYAFEGWPYLLSPLAYAPCGGGGGGIEGAALIV